MIDIILRILIFSSFFITSNPIRGNKIDGIIGFSYIGNCSEPRFKLDPSWNEEEVEAIREASEAWNRVIAFDFGSLPIDDECESKSNFSQLKDFCIYKTNYMFENDIRDIRKNDKYILIFTEEIKEYNKISKTKYIDILKETIVHELGHTIGLRHLEEDVMNPAIMEQELPLINKISDRDIASYYKICFKD